MVGILKGNTHKTKAQEFQHLVQSFAKEATKS